MRYSDIDPDTGAPYSNYSSPAIDFDYDREDDCPHSWVTDEEDLNCVYCELCGELES